MEPSIDMVIYAHEPLPPLEFNPLHPGASYRLPPEPSVSKGRVERKKHNPLPPTPITPSAPDRKPSTKREPEPSKPGLLLPQHSSDPSQSRRKHGVTTAELKVGLQPRKAPLLEATGPEDTSYTTTTSLSEIGTRLASPLSMLSGVLIAPKPTLLNYNTQAFGFLIRRAFGPAELPFLIDAIFSSRDESDIIRRIRSGDDAQTFVDVIDEARSVLARHFQTQPINVDAYTFC